MEFASLAEALEHVVREAQAPESLTIDGDDLEIIALALDTLHAFITKKKIRKILVEQRGTEAYVGFHASIHRTQNIVSAIIDGGRTVAVTPF